MRTPTRELNLVLGTGQSLSVGWGGSPPLTTTQPFSNVMFSGGVMPGRDGLDALVPLIEGDTTDGVPVETLSSSFANHATTWLPSPHRVLVAVHGRGGTPYAGLAEGTEPFADGLAQLAAARRLAERDGDTLVVRAVTVVHGESDHSRGNMHYKDDLLAWQAAYGVPLLHSQVSSWPWFGSEDSAIPSAQLDATLESRGKIILVGAKYHLPYIDDGLHLSNVGYRRLGAEYAKAYAALVRGRSFLPLHPTAVTRAGRLLRARFHVPAPPLVLDTTLVSNPGDYGFAYEEDGVARRIASVTLTGPDNVAIELEEAPAGRVRQLSYAMRTTPGAKAGPTTGPRGNLRDSDPTLSRDGDPLYAWCVHFRVMVD